MKKKIFVIIVIGTIVVLGVIMILINGRKENPLHLVERTLKITLPDSAKVERYTYYDEGGYYNIKISIDESQVSDLKNSLEAIFHRSVSKQDYSNTPNYKETCPWWDLDERYIIVAYEMFFDSERNWFKDTPDSHDVWAFLVKQYNGKYYLYIAY